MYLTHGIYISMLCFISIVDHCSAKWHTGLAVVLNIEVQVASKTQRVSTEAWREAMKQSMASQEHVICNSGAGNM